MTCSPGLLVTNYVSNTATTMTIHTGTSIGVLPILGGSAVTLGGTGGLTLNNRGTVDPSLGGSLSLASSGFWLGNAAARTAQTINIDNQAGGTIKGVIGQGGLLGLGGQAIIAYNAEGTGAATGNATNITNSGTIGMSLLGLGALADAPAIVSYGGAQTNFTNSGSITGRIGFASSLAANRPNTFLNAGTINGSVHLGNTATGNVFTAVSGSSVTSNGAATAGTYGTDNIGNAINASLAAAGIVDAGGGVGNRLVLQNSATGPGSGTAGAVTAIDSARYLRFQHLTVNSGTWNLLGLVAGSGTTINDGLVIFNNPGAFGGGTLNVNGGAIGASTTNLAVANAVALNSGRLTLVGTNGFGLDGTISGPGGLTVNNTGVVGLGAANTFSGGVNLNAGGLLLGSAGALGSGTLTVGGSAQLAVTTAGMVIANNVVVNSGAALTVAASNALTLNGVLAGAGAMVKTGASTLTLTGTNSISGGMTVTAGTLAAGSSKAFGTGAVSLAAGTTLQAGANNLNMANAVSLAGAATIDSQANIMTFDGVVYGAGRFTKTGTGMLVLNGSNTYAGGTAVAAGTLAAGSSSAFGTGAISLAEDTTLMAVADSLVLDNDVALLGSATVASQANGLTLGGTLSGVGSLTKTGTGTLALAGSNTYTGGTTVAGGTLAVGSSNALGAGAVSLAAGTTLQAGADNLALANAIRLAGPATIDSQANMLTLSGVVFGAASLTKTGTGTLVLTGSNTYSGATAVEAGTLRVDGSIASSSGVTVAAGATLAGSGSIGGAVAIADGGTLAPGSGPGTLNVGSLTLNATSRLAYELGTPDIVGAGVNDLVVVSGALALDGIVDIASQAGFGEGRYTLFQVGSVASNDGLLFGAVPAGYEFSIDLGMPGQVALVVEGNDGMQFWNGVQTSADGTVHGGAGTWTSGTTNWTNRAGNAVSSWSNLTAVFSGPAGGTVTIASDQQIAGLQFATDGYVLNGPGALQVSAPDTDLRAGPGVTATIAAAILGSGGITKTGSGTIVLSGSNGYLGGTAINAGVLSVSSDGNLGDAAGGLTINGGTFATTASFDTFRAVALNGAGSVDVANGTRLEFGGNVSGAGSLSKLGAGTLVLSGSNTHSGGTVVSAGVLQAGSADALGSGALTLDGGTFRAGTTFVNSFANAIAVNTAGGTVDVNGQVTRLSGTIADGDDAGGTLAFVNSGTAIGAVELGGSNTYSGATSVGAGVTLTALSDGAFSPNSDVTLVAPNSALMANGRSMTVRSLSGSGLVVNGNATQAGSLAISLPAGTASFAGMIKDGEPGDMSLSLVKAGAGTQILTGTNGYTGGTTIAGGTLQIGDGGTTGSIIGDIANNGTLAFNRSDAASFAGAISGSGELVQLGTGTLALTGTSSYSGGTTIAAGTLQLGDGGTTGSIAGDVANHGMLAFNRSDAVVFSGTISGSGSLVQHGPGTLTLAGANSYAGGTTIAAGTLVGTAASFGSGTILNNAALVVDQPVTATFANPIDGTGSFTKRGTGNLKLTGVSGLTGPTMIEAGRLSVNGSLANSAVTVRSGAELGGNGTVGTTTVLAGGTIAPGNSIGTLTVNGNLVLAPGSTYAAEIAGNGGSDLISVSGTATVTGSTVTITTLDPETSYQQRQRYTLLSAAGGISGGFAGVVSNSAFLDLSLDPMTGEVGLAVVVKNGDPGAPSGPAVFQTVAQTRNQFTTAVGLNSLPQVGGTLALYNGLLVLDAPGARTAFDALSGEIHASAKTALINESWLIHNAMNDRLRSAFGTVGAAPMATMSYGFTADLAPAVKGPMPRLNTERFAIWGQGFGAWGRSEAKAGIAKLTRSTGGLMVGADVGVFDNLRFGLLAGYSRSEFDVKGRLSYGESDNYHLGVYGGGQWGALGLRTGASYTWHEVSTRRTVAFAGFGDRLQSDYNAGTAQVFGELGYRIDLGRASFEPFAGLAYVNLHTDGVREIGGAAALSGRSDDTGIGYSTLGLRASSSLDLWGMDMVLRGGLAWRHAFGDVDPAATLAFSGSNAFTVTGVPIAKNAALAEAGLDLAISRSATLGVSYTGQLAADAQDHAFKANLAVRF